MMNRNKHNWWWFFCFL